MPQDSTPSNSSPRTVKKFMARPSEETVTFLMQFARAYVPKKQTKIDREKTHLN